jgi:DNA-binding response OmpR family regulator
VLGRAHPIGLATARVLARLIETAMPLSRMHPLASDTDGPTGLVLRLLGNAEATLDGARLLLNRRQTEILAILALHTDGLSLDRLHALVYGDQPVTQSTLKAEVSHLRAALGGRPHPAKPLLKGRLAVAGG